MNTRSITLATAILTVLAPVFHASADDSHPAASTQTAVPPLTEQQREAIHTVIEDGACAAIIASGDAELQKRLMGENNINYTQLKLASIASRAMADSPAIAILPPPFATPSAKQPKSPNRSLPPLKTNPSTTNASPPLSNRSRK